MINTPLCSAACRFSEKTRQAQAQMVISHFNHDWYRRVLSTESGPAKQHISLRVRANPTSRQWSARGCEGAHPVRLAHCEWSAGMMVRWQKRTPQPYRENSLAV